MEEISAETAEVLGITVRYAVLRHRNGAGRDCYGICVSRGDERITLPDITCKEAQIRGLLTLMARNGVTPVCAKDVVEDWLLR